MESLSVELKRWIDPKCPEDRAKIVKTALALRNYGGGSLVIGFDNDSLEPDTNNVPQDVKAAFHIDVIQGLISKYASRPFEVTVEFPEREGQPYPVITVLPGVETPVAVKSDLRSGDKTLISVNDVYTRSLRANNTPSTTKATWKDWPDILKVCFDNREADIGRFLRRRSKFSRCTSAYDVSRLHSTIEWSSGIRICRHCLRQGDGLGPGENQIGLRLPVE